MYRGVQRCTEVYRESLIHDLACVGLDIFTRSPYKWVRFSRCKNFTSRLFMSKLHRVMLSRVEYRDGEEGGGRRPIMVHKA